MGWEDSIKRIIVSVAVLVALTSPVLAKHCPLDAKIITQAMVNATGLSAAQMIKVKTLRDEGMALHKSGKHGASIKALHEATHILGVEPYKPS
jgi:hypothetical protein